MELIRQDDEYDIMMKRNYYFGLYVMYCHFLA